MDEIRVLWGWEVKSDTEVGTNKRTPNVDLGGEKQKMLGQTMVLNGFG